MSTDAERIEKKRQAVPTMYRKMFERCLAGKASKADAIRMQCLECWGYARTETATCDIVMCPLYHHRPYQKRARSRIRRVCASRTGERPELAQ